MVAATHLATACKRAIELAISLPSPDEKTFKRQQSILRVIRKEHVAMVNRKS
jgi:hypothetical protein